MHIRSLSARTRPRHAYIDQALSVFLQIIAVIQSLESLLGFRVSEKLKGEEG